MDNDEDSRISIEVSLPTDTHHCIRRCCPNCGLDFKVDGSDDLQSDALAWAVGQVARGSGLQVSVEDDEGADAKPKQASCPYCNHSCDEQDFLHPEHWSYMEALIFREYVEPMFNEMMESSFGNFPSNSSMSVTVTRDPRSPRPMVGPEPSDMVRIRCLACEATFKVVASWRGSLFCPDCSTELLGS